MTKYACGHETSYHPLDYSSPGKCYGCMEELFGTRVEFIRFGDIPDGGRSANWSDDTLEKGVSCYLVEGGGVVDVVRSEFGCRDKIIYGTAIVIDTGSDGEPIIDAGTIELLKVTVELSDYLKKLNL